MSRTIGEQQEINRALGLLERLCVAVESLSEHMQVLAVNSAVTNDVLITLAGAINPEYMGEEVIAQRGRHMFDVQLPDDDAVLCEQCQTVQPVDPHHPGHPAPHSCRPWKLPEEQLRAKYDSEDRSAAGDGGWSTHLTTAVPDRDQGSINPELDPGDVSHG